MAKVIEPVSGYSSYETFHVALFLSNNRPQYTRVKLLAEKAHERDPEELPSPVHWLADEIQRTVEGAYLCMDEREESAQGGRKSEVARDCDVLAFSLLSAALDRVEWAEIAEEWLNIAREG